MVGLWRSEKTWKLFCTVFSLIQVEVSSIIVPTLFNFRLPREFIDLSVVSVIRIRAGVRCEPRISAGRWDSIGGRWWDKVEELQTRLRGAVVGAGATAVLLLGTQVSNSLWVLISLRKKTPVCVLAASQGLWRVQMMWCICRRFTHWSISYDCEIPWFF